MKEKKFALRLEEEESVRCGESRGQGGVAVQNKDEEGRVKRQGGAEANIHLSKVEVKGVSVQGTAAKIRKKRRVCRVVWGGRLLCRGCCCGRLEELEGAKISRKEIR